MKFTNILEHLLGDPVKIRVYSMLQRHPEGLTGRGLGALVQTSPFKINRVLQELVRHGVVTEKVIGRAHQYRLNQEHIFVKEVLPTVLTFGNESLTSLGQYIMQKLSPKPLSVILYGSIARGDENADSDIDLFLIYAAHHDPGKLRNYDNMMSSISALYGNPVAIRRSRISDIQNPIEDHKEFLRNIRREGKSIAGLSITELLSYDPKAT
jgi:predicted nucleotidyltransferase/DNA-binding transcriptional ArsR family regulator